MKWINSRTGEQTETLPEEIIDNIYIKYFHFRFDDLTKEQDRLIKDWLERVIKLGDWDVVSFSLYLYIYRVPFTLRFSFLENLTFDENLDIYYERFLPFRNKLEEMGILKPCFEK